MQRLVPILLFILLCTLQSCGEPECNNTNPVFSKHQPHDIVYKDEVIKQIVGEEEGFRYIISGYEEKEYNSRYLNVSIRGDNICAKVSLLLLRTDSIIEPLIKAKGMGYHHAELKGLKFIAMRNCTSTEFVYGGAERIID